jgi:hypothetical protein
MNIGLFYALIPAVAYLGLVIFIYNRNKGEDLRQTLLQAGIFFVIYIVLIEEFLSLFHGITRIGLIASWLLLILILGVYFARLKLIGQSLSLPHITSPADWSGWLSLLLIVFVLVITFIVAWLSPPQTWDSLSYHLSRVAHWAQNHSVVHYMTGIDRQNSMNPGAEMITLNFYVLTQGDRLATFIQWFAMVGSMLGVSVIAGYLGAKKNGQWLSACFAITVPMGIVQSSSTITDYVATFWVVCAAANTLHYYKTHKNDSLIYLGLSTGLALLTKSTIVPFLVPIVLWAAILILRWNKPIQAVRWGFTSFLLVILVNTACFSRNYQTYGALYSPIDTHKHLNEMRNIPGTISNLLRNMGQQAGMPNLPAWNNWLDLNILKVHVKLGVDPQDPRTTNEGPFKVFAPITAEDLTTNPFHAALILITFPLSLFFAKKVGWIGFLYFTIVASGYVLFSFLFKWNVFAVRYQLIFFILCIPFVGYVWGKIEKLKLGLIVAYGLLIASLPWLFQISSRPILDKPGQLISRSILLVPRENLYYANAAGVEGTPYIAFHQIAKAIKDQGCSQIGIMLYGDSPEYLFWNAVGAPNDSIRLEWNVAGSYSDKYAPKNFQPCAFICEGCLQGGQMVRDQKFFLKIGSYELFMNPTKP